MIIYFSGTGNSHRAANLLADYLGENRIVRLEGDLLLRPERAEEYNGTDSEDRIIWVFPTYSWGIPPVVKNFMLHARIYNAGNMRHYLVTTCGDDCGLIDVQWRHLAAKRSWPAETAYSVIMPNTYVLMKGFDVDPADLAAQKLSDAPERLAEIARCIANDEPGNQLVRGRWAWIKSRIIYPWFVRFAMSPRPFRSNSGCTSCGKCAKSCPMNNIDMNDGKPSWGKNCALCLRCYHICPAHAVTYGKATNGKGQYILDKSH